MDPAYPPKGYAYLPASPYPRPPAAPHAAGPAPFSATPRLPYAAPPPAPDRAAYLAGSGGAPAPAFARSPPALDPALHGLGHGGGAAYDGAFGAAGYYYAADPPAAAPPGQDARQQPAPAAEVPRGAHFAGLKVAFDPPDLAAWRARLFDVQGTLVLTEDEFQTYFPHVDNVYSHRSTQRYKRKPFASHYWDCRLKGRPPGTAKGADPHKQKRRRVARARDLCDVKVKITEYFEGARVELRRQAAGKHDVAWDGDGDAAARNGGKVPGQEGERFYTVVRVSGTGRAGGADAEAHRHGLDESDRVKKNSVEREAARADKERRKGPKTYHKRATGPALATVKAHSAEHELKLYGSCFCPFVQRVWIALELKGLAYQYIEVDPYAKPASLLALNPLGLVPALSHESFACHESTVLLDYLDDAFAAAPLLPRTPQARARARLWADHVSKRVLPPFYRALQAQDPARQAAAATDLRKALDHLVRAADPAGPFWHGSSPGLVDVAVAPWVLRLSRVLSPYRGWPAPEPGSRWEAWVGALEACDAVRATVSGDDLYLDSYERYAENRPNTSKVADAINAGGALP